MIFQHTWKLVLEGRKTQTRRIVKPGDVPGGGEQFRLFSGDLVAFLYTPNF